jgi:hypothetical protein
MKLTKTCARFLRKNAGTLLAIGASVGVVLTAIETGKATIKAEKLVELNKDVPEYSMKEKVKDCWQFYIPAAVLGAGTIGCIIGSNMLSRKEIASLTAAYMALGKSYQQYRRQVAERVGGEEEKDILAAAQRKEEASPASSEKVLCYEPISKRYFHATETELLGAFYETNRDFTENGYVALNDFYGYLNLDFVPALNDRGWSFDYFAEMWDNYWINFSYVKQHTDDGLEVYYVSAFQEPIEDYLNYDPYKGLCEKTEEKGD